MEKTKKAQSEAERPPDRVEDEYPYSREDGANADDDKNPGNEYSAANGDD